MDSPRDSESPLIVVCIPTYKRPDLLVSCLKALDGQIRDGFRVSVVVVDNDSLRSAQQAVGEWSKRSGLGVTYVCEARQNIALARNAAVANAVGEYVAFIDDDEFPDPDWLKQLLECCDRHAASGVLAPVLPKFEGAPPQWLVKSGLCQRRAFPTGMSLTQPRYMRTGNVLFRRVVFDGLKEPFDPRFGRIGGEDAIFFGRMLEAGHRFVWCDEARVHEVVPAARQTVGYHLSRALVRGVSEAESVPAFSYGTLKSAAALILYGACLPVLSVFAYHLFVRYLVKCGDHAGKLLAYCGIRPIRERDF